MGDFDGPPGAADGRCTAAHGVIFLAVVPVEVKAARVSFHGGATASLLDSVAISKRVEGVLAVRHVWRDGNNHDGPRVANEGLFKHLRELASPKGSVILVMKQGSYAFFECEQRLVDLCALHARLAVCMRGICASL